MKNKLLLTIVTIIIIFIGALSYHFYFAKSSSAINRTGLVGWWTMDTNDMSPTGATLYDKSGQNNHGTVTGTTTSTGKIGQARSFDGTDDKITVSSVTNYSFLNGGTLSLWIKYDNLDVGSMAVAGTNDVISQGWALYMRAENTFEMIQYCDGGANWRYMDSTHYNNSSADGKWHHFVVTKTSQTSVPLMYFDGVSVVASQNSACTGNAINGSSFLLGEGAGFSDLNIPLDDVRVYNRALSAQEVAQLYSSAKTNYTITPSRSASSTGTSSVRGLVGYWTMDTNDMSPTGATLYDKSGLGNNGTVYGTTTSTGRINQARSFNGTSNWISVGQAGASLTNNFTLSAWFKSTGSNIRLITRRPSSTQWDFFLAASNGALNFYDGTTAHVSATPANNNKWHLGTVVINSASSAFYLDGVRNGNTFSPSITPVAGVTEIGSLGVGTSGLFSGSIDDVRIYNYALSAQEVANLYNSSARNYSVTPPRTGLVGYWTMDANDANGTTVYDKSGYGSHGTIVGTTVSVGYINQSRTFNTNNYIYFSPSNPATSTLSPTQAVTVSAWIKRTTAPTYYEWIVGTQSTAAATDGYMLFFNEALGYSFSINHYATRSYKPVTSDNDPLLSDGKWHHLIGTYDKTNVRLYFDGVAQTPLAHSTSINYPAASVLAIGRVGAASSYFWNGSIDDVRIYNRAFSAQEVANLYNSSTRNYLK